MHSCRICRKTENLKYTIEQLKNLYKKQKRKGLITSTSGNICYDCDNHLNNFDYLIEDDDSDLDVGGSRSSLKEDKTVIVDDDGLLLDVFYKKIEQRKRKASLTPKKNAKSDDSKQVQVPEINRKDESAVVEILTSRESTPTFVAELKKDNKQHRVLAFIDLEAEEDNVKTTENVTSTGSPRKNNVSASQSPKKSNSNENIVDKRRIQSEKEFRLIASLSLISSDSDDDEPPTKRSPKKPLSQMKTASISSKIHTAGKAASPKKNGRLTSPIRQLNPIPAINLNSSGKLVNKIGAIAAVTPRSNYKSASSPDTQGVMAPNGHSPDIPTTLNNAKTPVKPVSATNAKTPIKPARSPLRIGGVSRELVLSTMPYNMPNGLAVSMAENDVGQSSALEKPIILTIDLLKETSTLSVSGEKNRSPNKTDNTIDLSSPKEFETSTSSAKEQRDSSKSLLIALPKTNKTKSKCKYCKVTLPDDESLKVHERVHSGAKCPVCDMGYSTSQRLVQHLRFKHRSYEGDVLSERPRCAQDSAMTIRLRYQQRYIYYECQMCGRIDSLFKDHKDHVVDQHSPELKSLKDPIVKELKCFVCRHKCGSQYIQLCRHLLTEHRPSEYKPHMRDVTQTRFHATVDKSHRHTTVERTARVYQFCKRKELFFECKKCKHVDAGFSNHLRHINAKHKAENKEGKKQATEPPAKVATPIRKISKSKMDKDKRVNKALKETNAKEPIKLKPPRKTVTNASNKNEKKRSKLTKKTLQAALVKVKVKAPIRQISIQKYKCPYCDRVLKGFCKHNEHILQEHANREYLSEKQLAIHAKSHLAAIKDHKIHGSRRRKASHDENLPTESELHNMRPGNTRGNRRARPRVEDVDTEEEEAAAAGSKSDNDKSESFDWLQELKDRYNQRIERENQGKNADADADDNNDNDNTTTTTTTTANINHCHVTRKSYNQCCYCTHLFATTQELNIHESEHKRQNEFPIIRRFDLKTFK